MDGKDLDAEILEALHWRYAVKRFDPNKKISASNLETLKESLKLAPSSYGLQPWKFIWIQDSNVREQLFLQSRNQRQVLDCSEYVVISYLEKLDLNYIEKYISRISEVRAQTLQSLEEYKNRMIESLIKGPRAQKIDSWSQRQCFIALGFALQTAALLKIDACPMEGIIPDEYDKILKLSGTGYKTLATIAFGYRHPEDKYQFQKKVRW